MFLRRLALIIAAYVICITPVYGGVIIIGNQAISEAEKIDKSILSKIYTGRIVQHGGEAVRPYNMKAGTALRNLFMEKVLKQTDDDFIAYWIVRRSIGKGTPPVEVDSAEEMLEYIKKNPGAIGYLDSSVPHAGVKVILEIP